MTSHLNTTPPVVAKRLSAQDISQALSNLIGSTNVIATASDMAAWLTDWRGMYHGNAIAVVFPRSTADVSAVVRFCAEHALAIVPQGGNTGLCGGATPDTSQHNIVINLSRMNRVRNLNLNANTVVVEAGCILGDLQRLASDNERLFPIDLAAKDSCQIGGNLATNAGGINVLRYGMTRDQVLGLEVVLPNGDILDGLRTLKKDNTGYDLKQLFIGSEGTLGIITAAALKLYPKTDAKVVALAAVTSPAAALNLLSLLQSHCTGLISAFEYFSASCLELVLQHCAHCRAPFPETFEHFVLLEFSNSGAQDALLDMAQTACGQAIENGDCHDVILAVTEQQAASLWALRESITEALHQDGIHLKHDIALPVEHLPAFMEQAAQRLDETFHALRPFVFGHFGDGNLHYNVARPQGQSSQYLEEHGEHITTLVLDTVAGFNGSFSAEHGIGQLKRDVFRNKKSPTEIALMQSIKTLLDPQGLMNPGKIF